MAAVVTMIMDQSTFENMAKELQADVTDIKSFTYNTPTSGSLTTKDVTLGFDYRQPNLNVNVIKKNSFLAKVASDNDIEQHITLLLREYLK